MGDDRRSRRPVERPHAETVPERCEQGHPLGPGTVLVGWFPCSDCDTPFLGHRTYTCQVCNSVLYRPPHLC